MRITLILFVLVFFIQNLQGQSDINAYQYIIIPKNYEFLKGEDTYQLNSLAKFLFEKYGFTAFFRGNAFPEELQRNSCKALVGNVHKKPGVFLTKLYVTLEDCQGTVLFTSNTGQSREKDFKKAYHEALRQAFTDIAALQYKYEAALLPPSQETDKTSPIVTAANIKKENRERIEDPLPLKNVDSINPTGTTSSKKDTSNAPDVPTSSPATSVAKKEKIFVLNDIFFVFVETDKGFDFFTLKNEKRQALGTVIRSDEYEQYTITAGDYTGTGYFDAYGNFVLERINPVSQKRIKDILIRQ